MTINDRIKIFCKEKGISERQMAIKSGLHEGFLRKGKNLNSDNLAKVKKAYPELNIHWVFYGEGNSIIKPQAVNEPNSPYGNTQTIDDIVDSKINSVKVELQESMGSIIKEIIAAEIEEELQRINKIKN